MSRSIFGSLSPGGQQIAQRFAFAYLELSPAQLGEAMLQTHDILKDTPGWPPETSVRVMAATLELLGCPDLDIESPISEDELEQTQLAMERAFAMIGARAATPTYCHAE
jgi:hypothetical protein